jgi:NADPH:quinone reductase-like Zn-dependent oxidoreductase
VRAVHLTAFGNPVDCLELVEIPEPPEPRAGEVLVAVEFSPVNPNDLSVARGTYAFRPSLPSVIGNEGVGSVLRVGAGVDTVQPGDRVLLPLSCFAWRERIVLAAEGLFVLPAHADPEQLAMLGINPPTASLLLSEFVRLMPGDWVVQNAANSGVGRWVIAFAKLRGLRTVNIVRRTELVGELQALGGNLVLVDSPDVGREIRHALGENDVRLALDGVSGPATGALTAALAMRGTVVLYSAMSRAAITVNPLDVIFKSLTLRGFFMGHPEHAQKIRAAIREAAAMIAAREVSIPVAAIYPLSAIKEAVAHVQRGGKVLLDVTG